MSRSINSAPYRRLRAALVSARAKSGKTQVEVAKALRRPQSFVSKYESGERNLDVIEFVAVCRVLEIPTADVLEAL